MPTLPRRATHLAPAALALLCVTAPAGGQERPDAPDSLVTDTTAVAVRPDSAVVIVRGDTLGWLYGALGPFSVEERAAGMERRLTDLRARLTDTSEVSLFAEGERPEVRVGGLTVVVVTTADTLARGSATEAAAAMESMVREGLGGTLIGRNVRDLLMGLLWTVLTTVALFFLMRLMGRWYPRLYHRIRDIQEDRLPSLKFQGLVLVTGERIERTLLLTARFSRLVISGVLLFVYFPLVFSFFPLTRVLAQRIFALALEPTSLALAAVVGYLPNLFYIGVITVLTYYGLRMVHVVFSAVSQGAIRIPGFYADWAEPTYKLLRVLVVAFGVILVWPYLPNSDSAAFRGVAAFLGLLLTFGSAGAVSNVVGGVVMIYMRPFQIGDRVKIADTEGDVVERGMLVTRIRTPKNVEITIPNAMVLGSHIINYSTTARETGVVLHTTVTIGYDAAWQKVHEVMKAAALRTDGILADPAPFVLQTALGDYAVSYELNAYTNEPSRMSAIYSGLHENLQDTFAESGIEILSPVYHALRDGNLAALPQAYAPNAAASPAFRVTRIGD